MLKTLRQTLVLTTLIILTGHSSSVFAQPGATAVERLKVAKDFKVELLYTVPKDKHGSWVAMTPDPKGRLYVSDQYGKLYRVTPPGILGAKQLKIEPVPVEIGHAQGMVWAFDSLYVVLNTRDKKLQNGLHRLRDTDNDDVLDDVKLLRALEATGGEHGPHAVMLSPDGKTLTLVAGNQTKLTKIDRSRVPRVWDEDNLLPRVYGRGFMKGTPAPGGWIAKTDPNGKTWELLAVGFRNQYDAAYNKHGDLFTYDADMEWDMNTPWYRPTRVNHVVSGAEFGWRNGGGKWPAYYPDSVGSVIDIGPGSPTGVTFGYGAKFPAKYQNALFICDWSYGKMYAVHMEQDGASYKAEKEEFITGVPLPLTDIVINPADQAMYFAIGGRRVQSGLYRVTYTGSESTNSAEAAPLNALHQTRRKLEALHWSATDDGGQKILVDAWKFMNHSDRAIRYAARIAVEHQHKSGLRYPAFNDTKTDSSIQGLLAYIRKHERPNKKQGGKNIELDTPVPTFADESEKERPEHREQGFILNSLGKHDWQKLSDRQKLDLVRVYSMAFIRFGKPLKSKRDAVIAKFNPVFPTGDSRLDVELIQLLVYLQTPDAAKKGVQLLEDAPTQEEQIAYAKALRFLRSGWTIPLRKRYFTWFNERGNAYAGGMSFGKFMDYIKTDAVAALTAKEKTALKKVLDAKPKATEVSPFAGLKGRQFVKNYTVKELVPVVEKGLQGRDFQRGRKLFGAVGCFACHRFDDQGGAVGPDLTGLSGRFNVKDLLESIIEPSKTISDQYEAVQIRLKDGDVVYGRIVNLTGDTYRVNPNMLDPKQIVHVKTGEVESIKPSTTSMMPTGLLTVLKEDEVLDLMAYLLSRGDRNHAMFKK